MKKVLIALITIVLLLLAYTVHVSLKETENIDEKAVTEEITAFIDDMLIKDITPAAIKEKYPNYQYTTAFDTVVPFNNQNILSFLPSTRDDSEKQNTCLEIAKDHYQEVYDKYMDNLDYEIKVDKDNKLIDLEIKAFHLTRYNFVLTRLTELYIEEEEISIEEESEAFLSRCSAINLLKTNLDDFTNDNYSRLRFKFEIDDANLKILDPYSLAHYLMAGNYYDVSSEKSIAQYSQLINHQAEEYFSERNDK